MKENKYLRDLYKERNYIDNNYHTFYSKSEDEFYERFKCCKGCLVLATCMDFKDRNTSFTYGYTAFDPEKYPYLITIKRPCKKFERTYGDIRNENSED